jgi:hypothetical protein
LGTSLLREKPSMELIDLIEGNRESLITTD